MTVSETLAAAVTALRSDLQSAAGIYERRVFANSNYSLFVAVSQPSGLNLLLFVVSRRSVRRRLEIETRGFRLQTEPYTDPGYIRIRLEETHRSYSDLFIQLCDDVVSSILSAADERLAVENMRTRVEHWQRFVERASEGLSATGQLGLYGELYFLKKLLLAGVSPATVLEGWQGPLAANHDFMFGNAAIEVKCTSSNQDSRVTISNERQLDDTGVESLFLCHLSVDRREQTEATLPAIVEWIAGLIDIALLPVFEDRLLAAGYHRSHEALYGDIGYTERKMMYYRVSEKPATTVPNTPRVEDVRNSSYTKTAMFPRIVPNDLRNGVHEVQYVIELSSASRYLVSDLEILNVINRSEQTHES